MTEPDQLKLAALDEEDLAVVSAHVQDAVLKVEDLIYLPKEGRFVLAMNRFIWESVEGKRRGYERRRSALTFDRVRSVRTSRIPRDRGDAILNLLAVEFEMDDAPAGAIILIFADSAAIRLDVECVEVRLADLGPAWATTAKPSHELGPDETTSES